MSKILYLIILLPMLFSACCKNEQRENAKSKQDLVIVDSPTERHSQALKVIAKYPMAEWSESVITKISAVTGKAVSDEVRMLARTRLDEKALLEQRISMLTEIYTATELAKLVEIYSTTAGKELLKKTSVHDDKLRERIEPLVIEVLSRTQ